MVFLALVVLAVAGALVVVSERAAVTRTGYRIAELERERIRLAEQNRTLYARVARLKTASNLVERAKTFQLDVVPPEESLKEQYAKPAKDQGRRPGGATKRGASR
jgi:hypothetical protein